MRSVSGESSNRPAIATTISKPLFMMSWQGVIAIEALERRLIGGRSIFGNKSIPPRVRDPHRGDFDHLAPELNTPARYGCKPLLNKGGESGGFSGGGDKQWLRQSVA